MTEFALNTAPIVEICRNHLAEQKPYLYVDSVYKTKILETTMQVTFLCIISRRGDDIPIFYECSFPLSQIPSADTIKVKRLDN